MYLKSIELYGFKSFAHKMLFEFHNGITGIVGPNGSGKSNVADAVRWVLGEQSIKSLRGASMQDVIFAGTESRRPLSYAYVALTMDNSDHVLPVEYEEVTIARRLYRSGESEYLLNGNPCRLKDVYELFYDTGIGKEGYSIIGQGQVEKILSGKPDERRELFDEACGIVKYKKRKSAAVKKLEQERDNLVRVNDILTEQEKRIVPLARQAEDARNYLKYKEELKKIDVVTYISEIDRLNSELDKVKNNANNAVTSFEESKQQQFNIIKNHEEIEKEITDLDEKISSLKEQQSNAVVMKNKLENEILLLEEQIKSANSADENLEKRIAQIEEEKASKLALKAEYDKQNEELSKVLSEVNARLESVKANYEEIQSVITNNNLLIDKDNAAIMELLTNRASIKSREERYDTMMEQTAIRKAKLNQRLLERKTRENDLDSQVNDAKDQFDVKTKELEELNNKEKQFMEQLISWKNKRSAASEEMSLKRDELARVSTKLESLRNIAERYEGYGNSTRKVLEQKDNNPKVCGVISDLIHVDKKYETAIETALGGNIQNIVTEDEACAKEMINFLKENKLGRCTFLPLDAVDGTGNFKKTEVLSSTGVIGLANELVDCESRFNGVVAYLLGRVVVVDALDNALKIAKKNNYSIHMVTLDGEYLSPGGSLTGGRFKNSSSLLSRNREIEELEKRLKELETDIKNCKDRIVEIETAQSLLESDRADNQALISELSIVVNTARLSFERANEQKEESLKAYEGLTKESQELDLQISEIDTGKKEIESLKKNSEEKEKLLREEISRLAKEVDEKTYSESAVSRSLSETQIEEANARQKVDFVIENINRVLAEISKCEEDILNIKNDAKSSKDDVTNKTSQIEAIKKTIIAGEEEYKKLEASIAESIALKEQKTAEQKSFFDKRQEITDRIAVLDKEIFRLDQQREKLSSQIDYHNNYMWNEYELTYHSARDLGVENLGDEYELKQRATEIKDSIRKMGNVNVNAIEEYATLNEEYTFKKNQRDDLVEAEATLVAIIEELDEGMKKQFTEGFANIQVEFDKTFKELFGGGNGKLKLVDDEDILECGIIIDAQPPGKTLQNMMQLSGGEKSLTAIALLFAIQNLKPSPFCLLDEIEAALDDANVDRFSKYLHKLTKNTQFIVITHRRGTMNSADRLYGITMQEKGVSALVSVNLVESELDD